MQLQIINNTTGEIIWLVHNEWKIQKSDKGIRVFTTPHSRIIATEGRPVAAEIEDNNLVIHIVQ